jgi:hypothetical protein
MRCSTNDSVNIDCIADIVIDRYSEHPTRVHLSDQIGSHGDNRRPRSRILDCLGTDLHRKYSACIHVIKQHQNLTFNLSCQRCYVCLTCTLAEYWGTYMSLGEDTKTTHRKCMRTPFSDIR